MLSTKVFKDGTVITFNDHTQKVLVLPRASVVIVDDRISEIAEDFGSVAGRLPQDAEIVDVSGKIISPGFVNTHVHMWQTAYRSIGPDVSLVHYFDWVSQTSDLARKAFTPDDIYISTLEGYLEGLNGGVTSYVDHAHNNWSPGVMEKGFEAVVDSGARVYWCYEPMPEEGFPMTEQWEMMEKAASKPRTPLVEIGLGYLALHGKSGDEFDLIKNMIEKIGVKAVTTHHLGGPWPSRDSSPSELAFQPLASLELPIIVSHAPYLSEDDMSALRDRNIHISITPESEFHYGHGQTTGHLVSDQASLGVDTNWTFSGDILTQARLWLGKVRDTGFQNHLQTTGTLPRNTPFTAEQGFLLATRQGGKALWRDDIGVLKAGAKADLVVFNGDSPNMLGWSNALAAVMLHANVGDIQHVLVDGQWRKRDFQLVGLKVSWEEVKGRFLEAARRIQPQAFPPPPVTERLWGFKETEQVGEWSTIRE